MIQIAIYDEIKTDAEALRDILLSCNLTDVINAEIFLDPNVLECSVQEQKFDVLFFNADTERKKNDNLCWKIRHTQTSLPIILCTSSPEFVLETYGCAAFQYLIKPLSAEKTENALLIALHKLSSKHNFHYIRSRSGIVSLPIDDIFYIEYCQKHIIYHTNKDSITRTGKLSDVYGELIKYGFFQVHQGYIVNLSKIRNIDGYTASLENGDTVPISVRKKSMALRIYKKYVTGK